MENSAILPAEILGWELDLFLTPYEEKVTKKIRDGWFLLASKAIFAKTHYILARIRM